MERWLGVLRHLSLLFLFSFILQSSNGQQATNEWQQVAETRSTYIVNTFWASSFGSFYESTQDHPWSYCWPTFSAIAADLALLSPPSSPQHAQQQRLTRVRRTVEWVERVLWDKERGGFYAAAFVDGSFIDISVKYSDDNAWAGIVCLDGFAILTEIGEEELADKLLQIAMNTSIWLQNSGIWASSEGGGFWWNTQHTYQLRPDNSNALAAQLFARLAVILRDNRQLQWAQRTTTWMEENLYVPSVGLFQWTPESATMFTYTNGLIAAGYHYLSKALPTGKDERNYNEDKAVRLIEAVRMHFWDASSEVFVESTVSGSVATVLSGWIAQVLTLFVNDTKIGWAQEVAEANVRYLNRFLRENSNSSKNEGAFYLDCYPDGTHRRWATGRFDLLDSAWGQYLNAIMALNSSKID